MNDVQLGLFLQKTRDIVCKDCIHDGNKTRCWIQKRTRMKDLSLILAKRPTKRGDVSTSDGLITSATVKKYKAIFKEHFCCEKE